MKQRYFKKIKQHTLYHICTVHRFKEKTKRLYYRFFENKIELTNFVKIWFA